MLISCFENKAEMEMRYCNRNVPLGEEMKMVFLIPTASEMQCAGEKLLCHCNSVKIIIVALHTGSLSHKGLNRTFFLAIGNWKGSGSSPKHAYQESSPRNGLASKYEVSTASGCDFKGKEYKWNLWTFTQERRWGNVDLLLCLELAFTGMPISVQPSTRFIWKFTELLVKQCSNFEKVHMSQPKGD